MKLTAAMRQGVADLACSDLEPERLACARDLWPRHHLAVRAGRVAEHLPAAVAWPNSTEQVAALVRWCGQRGVPLVPFGAGSGVCGGVLPTAETVVLDLKGMRRWRRFDTERGLIEAEAGVMGIRLEEDLAARGYTVGHFPSSILCSTVGGWIAGRGAGQCSGLYGKIEDMVAELECVDGRGEVARLQRRIHGPDLTPLMIGSEGILAVITSATLRLHAAPAQRAYCAMSFETMQRGYQAIREIYQRGLRPAVCRLYDAFDSLLARQGARRQRAPRTGRRRGPGFGAALLRTLLRVPGALNAAVDALGGPVFGGCTLVLVFEGPATRAAAECEAAQQLGRAFHAVDLGEGPARHWLEHRYSVSYRQAPTFMAGAFADTMEVAAPWSRFGALYDEVRRALGAHVFVMAHMSHAYPDGCSIYFTFAGSAPTERAAVERYDRAWRDALAAAIDAGGTLSHHHGVGRSKAAMLDREIGAGVEVIRGLKGAFDPQGVLNAGNLLPAQSCAGGALPEPPARPRLDRHSLLVHAAGGTTLAAIERQLTPEGLTLGLDSSQVDASAARLDDWLGAGAPGACDPWLDPVDHLVAGFDAKLAGGAALALRPCPRRAVGPDLLSLLFGTEARCGHFVSAHLRARRTAAAALDTGIDRTPGLGSAESVWIDRAVEAARATR